MVRIPGASRGIAARLSHLLAKGSWILKWFEPHPQDGKSANFPQLVRAIQARSASE